MEWIAETLRVFGFINREHLERKFGLSTPQASIDIRNYLKANPDTAIYSVTEKRYKAVQP
jgi:hypothetical protein